MAKELTAQQLKAADLLIAGKSVTDTAKEIGVARETVSRWNSIPEFKSAITVGVRYGVQRGVAILAMNHYRAAQMLVDMLDQEKPDRVKMDLCKTILSEARQGVSNEELEAEVLALREQFKLLQES